MDYKEAIEELESLYRHCSDMISEFEPNSVWRADCKALDVAISAMQELEEYHKTGLSPEQVSDTICELSATKRILGHYKQLGTLKEVRKAVEKQKPKKVTIEDVGYNQYRNVNLYACICPSCGLHIIEFDDDDVCESDSDNPAEMFHDCLVHHAYIGRNNYCDRCGQKLDWTEGACEFLIPDEKACYEEYGEGPLAFEEETDEQATEKERI